MNLDQFFAGAVGDDMMDYLAKMHFSSFFLFSCGSVVEVESARQELKATVKK